MSKESTHPSVKQPTRGWTEIMAAHLATQAPQPISAKEPRTPMQWEAKVEPPVVNELKTPEKPVTKPVQWKHKADPDQARAELEAILRKGLPSSEPPVPVAVRRRSQAKDGQEQESGKGGRQ